MAFHTHIPANMLSYDRDDFTERSMTAYNRLATAFLLTVAIPVAALAQTGDGKGTIRSVTLSSGGLAEIAREADVRDGGLITLDVPVEQVNDILKSLVVRDGAGSVKSLSLPGAMGPEEIFRKLPFNREDFASLSRLLGSVQGAKVEVTSGGKTLSGRVLGVEERPGENGASEQILSLLDANGVSVLPLQLDTKVRFLNEDIAQKLTDAAVKTGDRMAEASRTISVHVNGSGKQKVFLTYVVPAPVWRTSYRLVRDKDGSARLQAWAILENETGEDWSDVQVTLTSGNPSTLRQELYEPLWRDRQEINIASPQQPTFRADEGAAAPAPVAEAAQAMRTAAAPRMREDSLSYMAAPGQTAATVESDVASSFALPGLHSLAAGDTISIPIIDQEIPAEMVSTYRAGDGSEHPIAAIEIRNNSDVSLPAGILTIYDAEQGYAGDSALTAFPAGETRLARFATDNKVRILHDTKPARTVTEVKVADGVLTATVKSVETTTYSVTGAKDGPRTSLIEHPRKQGWTLTSDALDSETQSDYRLKTRLDQGQTASVLATEEQINAERYALVDADPQLLLDWSSSATPETSKKLEELARARRAQDDARRSLEKILSKIEQISEEQARIRENIAAVPDNSDLQNRYLSMMEDLEDEIADLNKQRRDAEEQSGLKDDGVRDIIRTF